MPDSTAVDLIAHAHDTRVVVVGGGISGLVTALELAKVGIAVTVLEASDRPGGAVAAAELDGMSVDLGADGFAPDDVAVTTLIDELGLADDVVAAPAGIHWITGLPAGAAPIPADSLLGIPANAWADDVRRIIGWRGAWRAYLDRLRPPLTIGHERSLGALVRRRLGARVADRLVAPITRGMLGLDPDDIDIEEAAPGLNTALTRVGSLGGAVAQQLGDDQGRATLEGGMTRLVAALTARIIDLGGDVRVAAPVTAVERVDDGWHVRTATTDEQVPADAVVIATGQTPARRLLTPLVSALPPATGPAAYVDAITVVVTSTALDDCPRGVGVYPMPGTSPLTALTHLTAAWPALAAAAGPGRHILRITQSVDADADGPEPTDGVDAPEPTGADAPHAVGAGVPNSSAAAVDRAVRAAAALLDVDLDGAHVRAARRRRHELAPPPSARAHRADRRAVHEAVHAVEGLAVIGAWVSGGTLDAVIADARVEAERVRHHVLWERH